MSIDLDKGAIHSRNHLAVHSKVKSDTILRFGCDFQKPASLGHDSLMNPFTRITEKMSGRVYGPEVWDESKVHRKPQMRKSVPSAL